MRLSPHSLNFLQAILATSLHCAAKRSRARLKATPLFHLPVSPPRSKRAQARASNQELFCPASIALGLEDERCERGVACCHHCHQLQRSHHLNDLVGRNLVQAVAGHVGQRLVQRRLERLQGSEAVARSALLLTTHSALDSWHAVVAHGYCAVPTIKIVIGDG